MLISELIKLLQEVKTRKGDLPVYAYSNITGNLFTLSDIDETLTNRIDINI